MTDRFTETLPESYQPIDPNTLSPRGLKQWEASQVIPDVTRIPGAMGEMPTDEELDEEMSTPVATPARGPGRRIFGQTRSQ